jgi:hypothetical protein
LGGSNGVSGGTWLFLFTRGTDNTFSLYEDVASVSSLHGTAMAEK